LEPQIYREIDQRREPKDLEDAEDLTRRLQERYGRGAYAEPSAFVGDIAHVPMQFLLPSAKDPNLWLVRCKVIHSLPFPSFAVVNVGAHANEI
jgi:hypothetical protein